MSPQPPEQIPDQANYSIQASAETVVRVLQSRYPEQAARCIAEAAALELQDLNRALQEQIARLTEGQLADHPATQSQGPRLVKPPEEGPADGIASDSPQE
jgi:hypothetical protein